ncbi:hypothetical protein KGF57_002957 [Candida theae]|uniref:Reticulon-like protein n=1 Tax=Candida theae TaxID=1198502 RepID=A0AAD5BEM6_9ASCO|nr:uncharacterized protein KGF57_002957 [Candida theae]KAI5957691.1 hypothetical protein KGF57_002957 [Candida theae]
MPSVPPFDPSLSSYEQLHETSLGEHRQQHQQSSHSSHASNPSHGAQGSSNVQHESAIPTGYSIPPPIGETSSNYSSGPTPSKSELHQGATTSTSSYGHNSNTNNNNNKSTSSSHAAAAAGGAGAAGSTGKYTGSGSDAGAGLSHTATGRYTGSGSGSGSGSGLTSGSTAGSGAGYTSGVASHATSALKSDADPNHPIHEAEDFLTELLTWKNPVYTGKVLGFTLFGLILFKSIDLVRIFFKVSYITLLFSAGAEYIGKVFTGQGFVSNFYKNYSTSFAKPINKHLLPLIGELNVAVEHHLNYILYSRNVETTLKFAGISYIFYQLTSVVSLFALTLVSVILLFTIPPAYLANKKQVDAFVGEYTACFKQQVGKGVDQLHGALKQTPIGPYLQKFAPKRTAGSTVGDSKATSYGTEADTHGVNVHVPVGSTTSSSSTTGGADLRERNTQGSAKGTYY